MVHQVNQLQRRVHEYCHPSVSDRKELPEALTPIVKHLQNTIYQKAGKNLRDYGVGTRSLIERASRHLRSTMK